METRRIRVTLIKEMAGPVFNYRTSSFEEAREDDKDDERKKKD